MNDTNKIQMKSSFLLALVFALVACKPPAGSDSQTSADTSLSVIKTFTLTLGDDGIFVITDQKNRKATILSVSTKIYAGLPEVNDKNNVVQTANFLYDVMFMDAEGSRCEGELKANSAGQVPCSPSPSATSSSPKPESATTSQNSGSQEDSEQNAEGTEQQSNDPADDPGSSEQFENADKKDSSGEPPPIDQFVKEVDNPDADNAGTDSNDEEKSADEILDAIDAAQEETESQQNETPNP